jgi:Phage integrase, N-terminal SAM-like domain
LKIIIGKYQGTIYPEDNGYIGAIHLGADGKGNRRRIKRRGRTKEIVKDRLKKAVSELETGIETGDSYTVENAVRDWLARGTKGMSDKTINDYKSLAESNIIPFIGAYKLKELTADNVDDWLDERRQYLTTWTCKRSTRRSFVGPSGKPRPGTRSCATSLTWSTRRRARRLVGRARP